MWSSYLIVRQYDRSGNVRTPTIDPTRIYLLLAASPWREHAARFNLEAAVEPAMQWLADTPAAMLMLHLKLPSQQYAALLAAVNEPYFVKQDRAYNTP